MVDDALLTEYILEQLGKHVSRDNLIFDICQRTGLDWNHVSKKVAEVEQTHATKIARKQSPVLFIIALGIFIGGIYLAGGAVLYYAGLAQTGNFSIDPLSLRRDYVMLIRLGTGLAMIGGSIIGTLGLVWKMFAS